MSLRALGRALPLLLGVSLMAWAGPQVAAAQDAVKPAREQRARGSKRARESAMSGSKRALARASETNESRKKRTREGGARGRRARGTGAAEGAPDAATPETGARTEGAARSPQPPARRGEVSARSEGGSSARANERNAEAARAAAAGVDAEIVKEGDTSVKVMKFEGLGIEGRLKSPQLVYFVERTRAEFDHPTLPHRSFMPELERTTAREPMR